MPLHTSYGFDFGLLVALANGTTLFLEDEVSPKRIAKLLREQNIDFFAGNPALYGSLVRVPTVKPLKTSGARFLSAVRRCPRASPRASTSGSASACCPVTTARRRGRSPSTRQGKEPETVGRAFEGVEVRDRRRQGRRRRRRARSARSGSSSKTLSMLAVPKMHLPKRDDGVPIGGVGTDGWFRTGDLGQLDKNGRLTITGREDDLVKVDGKRVALGEVEGCLEAFPKIKAAQARVITDDLGGPMVVARVVRASMCRAEDIIDHCARNLAPYKVPRQIEFCESI